MPVYVSERVAGENILGGNQASSRERRRTRPAAAEGEDDAASPAAAASADEHFLEHAARRPAAPCADCVASRICATLDRATQRAARRCSLPCSASDPDYQVAAEPAPVQPTLALRNPFVSTKMSLNTKDLTVLNAHTKYKGNTKTAHLFHKLLATLSKATRRSRGSSTPA